MKDWVSIDANGNVTMSMDTFCKIIKKTASMTAEMTREAMLKTMFEEDEE